MNRAELVEAMAAEYDGKKTEAAKALDAVVRSISYELAARRQGRHRRLRHLRGGDPSPAGRS